MPAWTMRPLVPVGYLVCVKCGYALGLLELWTMEMAEQARKATYGYSTRTLTDEEFMQ